MPKDEWLYQALRFKGSVFPSILPRVILCGLFGLIISIMHNFGLRVHWPILSNLVPSLVLGLLLVFRTNTAYDRFWEGRKLWGTLVNTVRNLARQIWVAISEKRPDDIEEKIITIRLLVAFSVAMKLHLRGEQINFELTSLMPSDQGTKLTKMNNPPLEIAFWIGDYLQRQHQEGNLSTYQLSDMLKLLDTMVDVLGGCERILKTPIPLAYSIHIKQLLVIYCIALPFQMVETLTWFTGPVVALISFALFGIEAIGLEIENPFGRDPNDLPLDNICNTMLRNIEDLISLEPSVHQSIGKPETLMG
ncbi:MAG TPA: hypothetical protein IGS52_25360 [Oscillatoriaceae cyanobacterium M33_DOE_052]|uniref:Bestrophin n=1 Tax=Planktothricoides sp. SpSt-374 TaxID=2282167 RepID=A0A7C3ZIX0_9CYAN|nr:hypothetical protein [Oscillatoriaceae cyanobacterium M33_DOE_052]